MSPPETIQLSLNELRALLRRTYEALYHHGYDFTVMARSCLWLETHGLDGIGLILRSLDDLDTPCAKLVLSQTGPDKYLIDGQGRCLIPFMNASADLAIASAQRSGFGQIDILNIFGRLNIFAALKKAARLNLWAAALWYDEGDKASYALWLNKHKSLPDFYKIDGEIEGPWGDSGLRFVCARGPERVEAKVRYMLPGQARPIRTAHEFEACQQAALDNGLSVKLADYAKLNALADRLLVPSTDESRRGAGE